MKTLKIIIDGEIHEYRRQACKMALVRPVLFVFIATVAAMGITFAMSLILRIGGDRAGIMDILSWPEKNKV